MAEPLKNYFSEEFVNRLGEEILRVYPKFSKGEFVNSIINDEWEARELKERLRHVSLMLGEFLPDYIDAIQILNKVVSKFDDLPGMVFPDFVEVFGLDHLATSLDALELFTQYSSSEFAIRPFIVRNEKLVMDRMLEWSQHENHHVRRLASEGCRPRLPWAMALPEFKKDPSRIIPILQNLKDDHSEYVRKSVANNINDLTKDNPQIALELAKSWKGESSRTDWILKHGLRTLLKKGNEEALQIFGFTEKVEAEVQNFTLSDSKVKIGDELQFSFSVVNKGKSDSFFKIGFKVGYVKSNGNISEKIFHVTEKKFDAHERIEFKKKLSFKDLTTRKHFPGKHHIAVTINGEKYAQQEFEVTK